MQEPVGIRAPRRRPPGGGGGGGAWGTRVSAMPVVRPVGGATACVGDNSETNFAERNIARRQPVTPAPAAWGFCHGSRFAQKYFLRFAFAFTNDSDMDSGTGRVPESGNTSPIIRLNALAIGI